LRYYFNDACKKSASRFIDLRENTLFAKDFSRRDPALQSARRGSDLDALLTREFALPLGDSSFGFLHDEDSMKSSIVI